jgi:hypothetical protein
MQNFSFIRDLRFMEDHDRRGFFRRSTWLFPVDGCYARAQLGVSHLKNGRQQPPKKIFVYGDLAVNTPNAPSGEVTWWYHVAPIVSVAGVEFVLDPALEASRPLTKDEWLKRQSQRIDDLEIAICDSGTYLPYDQCENNPVGDREISALNDQREFLTPERQRLLKLKRNPDRELGDQPPWL